MNIALGVPILYSMANYSLCLILGFIAVQIGFIEEDENDKAASCGKLFKEWRNKGDDKDLVDNVEHNNKELEVETNGRTEMVDIETNV